MVGSEGLKWEEEQGCRASHGRGDRVGGLWKVGRGWGGEFASLTGICITCLKSGVY